MLPQNLLDMGHKPGNLFKHFIPFRKAAIVSGIVISEMNGKYGQIRKIGKIGAISSKAFQGVQ